MKKVLKKLKLNKKGFTFAECVVAIALFAIVGTLAFTMFNTSAKYMQKAKREEAKLAESQEMAYKENFKNAEGKTIIYGKNVLHIEYVVTGNRRLRLISHNSAILPRTAKCCILFRYPLSRKTSATVTEDIPIVAIR